MGSVVVGDVAVSTAVLDSVRRMFWNAMREQEYLGPVNECGERCEPASNPYRPRCRWNDDGSVTCANERIEDVVPPEIFGMPPPPGEDPQPEDELTEGETLVIDCLVQTALTLGVTPEKLLGTKIMEDFTYSIGLWAAQPRGRLRYVRGIQTLVDDRITLSCFLMRTCEKFVAWWRERELISEEHAKYMDPCLLVRTQTPQRPWPSALGQPSLTPDLPDETIVSRRLKTRLIW
jgi:hypothetical protein